MDDLTDKPNSLLPNGKSNPAYYRWRRRNGIDDPAKWNDSEKGKQAQAKYRHTKKGKASIARYNQKYVAALNPEQYAESVMASLGKNCDLY